MQHNHNALLFTYLLVFQVFYLGSVVAVSLAVTEDLEPRHADGVNDWTTVRKKLHFSDLKKTDYLDIRLRTEMEKEKSISSCHRHGPVACSRSRQSLWARPLCTCRTAWCPSPWNVGSWGGSVAQTHAVGRGWWGRPWCTQRWALLGSGFKKHRDKIVLNVNI